MAVMGNSRRLTLASGFLAVLIVGAAMAALIRSGAPVTPLVTVDEVRDEGVVFIEKHDLFVVWNDGDPLALSSDAQHIGDQVLFCPSSGLFESPSHGEKFDKRGYYIGGPAQRGLGGFPVRSEGVGLYVSLAQPIEGAPRGAGPPLEPEGRFCTESGIAKGEAGFFADTR